MSEEYAVFPQDMEKDIVSPFTCSMVRPPRAWASPNMKRGESDFGQLQDLKSEFRWKSFDT